MTEEQINRANEFAKSKRHTIPPKMGWRRWGETHLWMAMGHVKGEGSELAPILYNAQKDIISFFSSSDGVFVLSEGNFVGYVNKVRAEEKQAEEKAEVETVEKLTQQEIDEICDDLMESFKLGTIREEEISTFEKAVMSKKYGNDWFEELGISELLNREE